MINEASKPRQYLRGSQGASRSRKMRMSICVLVMVHIPKMLVPGLTRPTRWLAKIFPQLTRDLCELGLCTITMFYGQPRHSVSIIVGQGTPSASGRVCSALPACTHEYHTEENSRPTPLLIDNSLNQTHGVLDQLSARLSMLEPKTRPKPALYELNHRLSIRLSQGMAEMNCSAATEKNHRLTT